MDSKDEIVITGQKLSDIMVGNFNTKRNTILPRIDPVPVEPVQSRDTAARERTDRPTGSVVSDNSYAEGYCTWWVKKNSSAAQNGWGNAKNWPVNSRTPEQGGIVKLKSPDPRGHVALVENVKDGEFEISEMNYEGWNKVSYRTLKVNSDQIIGFYN